MGVPGLPSVCKACEGRLLRVANMRFASIFARWSITSRTKLSPWDTGQCFTSQEVNGRLLKDKIAGAVYEVVQRYTAKTALYSTVCTSYPGTRSSGLCSAAKLFNPLSALS